MNMTDKEAKKFYNSKEWKRKREDILERDNHECQDCKKRLEEAARKGIRLYGKEAKIWRAEQVHHKIELKERPDLGLDDKNLTSLCTKCHNIRHGREPMQFVRKRKKKLLTEEKW